jgi:hypothetical protein
MQFLSQNSRFLCNCPDRPLKVSGCPTMSRSFSVEDVRTSGQHCPDARSSFSNFYLELDFMFRHGSGNSNRSDGRATPSGRFSGFQEDFCTRLSVFIMLESLEKMIQLDCLDGQWKRPDGLQKFEKFRIPFQTRS